MALHVVNHPVVTHKMNILRDRHTGTQDFRSVVSELTLLLAYEATRDLRVQDCVIETPLAAMDSKTLTGGRFIIAPILRAGLGMVQGMLSIFPNAKVAHIGIRRDEETARPETYYYNFPRAGDMSTEKTTVIVLDPMLATAGSLCAALNLVKRDHPGVIKAICLIAAPEGQKRVEKEHPDVDVYVGALDQKLNEKSYIVPGLGDAGDRMFGTV